MVQCSLYIWIDVTFVLHVLFLVFQIPIFPPTTVIGMSALLCVWTVTHWFLTTLGACVLTRQKLRRITDLLYVTKVCAGLHCEYARICFWALVATVMIFINILWYVFRLQSEKLCSVRYRRQYVDYWACLLLSTSVTEHIHYWTHLLFYISIIALYIIECVLCFRAVGPGVCWATNARDMWMWEWWFMHLQHGGLRLSLLRRWEFTTMPRFSYFTLVEKEK